MIMTGIPPRVFLLTAFYTTLCTALCAVCVFPATTSAEDFDHGRWEMVLGKFVNEQGRVDYGSLKKNHADLDAYVAALAARSPRSHPGAFPSRSSQLAYWINAYNALTIAGVVENWPVPSVRKIGWLPFAFFRSKKFTAGGRQMTLDEIENILRRQLREPRIHFAIVCASNSCPHLQRRAYTAENVMALLDQAGRAYVNDPRNLSMDAANNRATIPSIFKWFHQDFDDYARRNNLSVTGNAPLDFMRQFASDENRRAIDALKNPRVDYFDYDWGINDLHAPAGAAQKPGTP
jgi:hypothetical protein